MENILSKLKYQTDTPANALKGNIHMDNIISMGFANSHETHLWIDSIINDTYCLDHILWLSVLFDDEEKKSFYEKLSPSKKLVRDISEDDMKKLPEFSSLVEKYRQELLRKNLINLKEQEKKEREILLSDKLAALPDWLQKDKQWIQSLETSLANLQSKWYRKSDFLLDFLKKHPDTENDIQQVLSFILQSCESSKIKKDFENFEKNGQSAIAFCKKVGRDYTRWEAFQKKLNDKKLKFSSQKTKLNQKVLDKKPAKENKQDLSPAELNLCEKQALEEIKTTISKKNDLYTNNDVEKMFTIQSFLRQEIDQNTTEIFPKEKFLEGEVLHFDVRNSIWWSMKKINDKIELDKTSYLDLSNQYNKAKDNLIKKNEEELKSFIFDRLVEYIVRYYLKYKITEEKVAEKNTSIKKISLFKTNILDDTYWWADYLLALETNKEIQIGYIDAFVANLDVSDINDIDNSSLPESKKNEIKEKLNKAKRPKEEYSSDVQLLELEGKITAPIKKKQRIVSYVNSPLAYAIMADVFKNPDCLKDFSTYFKNAMKEWWSIFQRIINSNERKKINLIQHHIITTANKDLFSTLSS